MKNGVWLLAISLLLLAACQFQFGQQTQMPPYIATGTQALDARFQPTSMNNIYMCQEADLLLMLKNLGTADIENGVYSFILEDQVIQPTQKRERQKTFNLEGKSQYNPTGGIQQVALKVRNPGLPSQLEVYDTPVIFQACYDYETYAGVPVCIDPDLRNLNPQKTCRAQLTSLGGGQGAPVAVTRVEPSMTPDGPNVKPTFVIYVQNLGNGRAISQDAVEAACGTSETATLESRVDVNVQLQDEQLDCTPRQARLEEGKETRIVCRAGKSYGQLEGTFSTILEVQLDYGYMNTAVLPVTITRLPGQPPC
ncbi:hypothetical protein HY489_04060 [Candidatus Woesearchaeota archaeon]|nr:hypothetical protein [Candidatus Woesearchaeota archaeon]